MGCRPRRPAPGQRSAALANGTQGGSTARLRFSRTKTTPCRRPARRPGRGVSRAQPHGPVTFLDTGTTAWPVPSSPVPCRFRRGMPSRFATGMDRSAVREPLGSGRVDEPTADIAGISRRRPRCRRGGHQGVGMSCVVQPPPSQISTWTSRAVSCRTALRAVGPGRPSGADRQGEGAVLPRASTWPSVVLTFEWKVVSEPGRHRIGTGGAVRRWLERAAPGPGEPGWFRNDPAGPRGSWTTSVGAIRLGPSPAGAAPPSAR